MQDQETFRTVTLERMRIVLLQRVSKGLAGLLANPIDVEAFEDLFAEDAMLRLKAVVMGEHIETPAVRYPKDWKEAVRERFFPEWALRRWPVQYTEKVFDTRVVYPMISLPLDQHSIAEVCVKERRPTFSPPAVTTRKE